MMEQRCCVGYVKPMRELPRITAVDAAQQRAHIQAFAGRLGLHMEQIYTEPAADSSEAYRRLTEAAVHRDFSVMLIDNIYCFGQAIFPAADFIEHVMLPLGLRLYIAADEMLLGGAGCEAYLSRSRGCMRSSLAMLSQQRNSAAGVRSRRAIRQPAPEPAHDLAWYEERQVALFHEMLGFPDNFDALEAELQSCRRAIRKLRL